MPTYEYECEKCGKLFEKFQSITAEPVSTCPDEACGGKVRRLLSPGAGFLFKGKGFYITDYRSESYKNAAKTEEKKSGSASAKESSGSKPGSDGSSKTAPSKSPPSS